MARLMVLKKRWIIYVLKSIQCILNVVTLLQILLHLHLDRHYRKHVLKTESYFSFPFRQLYLHNIIFHDNTTCVNQLRMTRATFAKLCDMLRTIGKLSDTRHYSVEEMIAMFFHILAHHVKNRVIINKFMCSSETISRHFNEVLNGVYDCKAICLKNQKRLQKPL